jgi:hypothetical protein
MKLSPTGNSPVERRARDAIKVFDLQAGRPGGALEYLLSKGVTEIKHDFWCYTMLVSALGKAHLKGAGPYVVDYALGAGLLEIPLASHAHWARPRLAAALRSLSSKASSASTTRLAARRRSLATAAPVHSQKPPAAAPTPPAAMPPPSKPDLSHLNGTNRTVAALVFARTGALPAWALPPKADALVDALGRPLSGLDRVTASMKRR